MVLMAAIPSIPAVCINPGVKLQAPELLEGRPGKLCMLHEKACSPWLRLDLAGSLMSVTLGDILDHTGLVATLCTQSHTVYSRHRQR